MSNNDSNKLNILWTNDNPTTAELMVFMYATNAKIQGWFDDVQIIIWGATAALVAENEDIQALVKNAKHVGVHISACLACVDALEVRKELEDQDIEVIYWGQPLTDIIKSEQKLITI